MLCLASRSVCIVGIRTLAQFRRNRRFIKKKNTGIFCRYRVLPKSEQCGQNLKIFGAGGAVERIYDGSSGTIP